MNWTAFPGAAAALPAALRGLCEGPGGQPVESAMSMPRTKGSARNRARCRVVVAITCMLLDIAAVRAQEMRNEGLSVKVSGGTYTVAMADRQAKPVLAARVGAKLGGQWIYSSDYPHCTAAQLTFHDDLGDGRRIRVACTGLGNRPDLIYTVQVYGKWPFGTVQVGLQNRTGTTVLVNALRNADAVGERPIDLGGPDSADRVLSDSFSEDWPQLVIYDLTQASGGVHRGSGSQLIYNRETKQSVFFGALTADRFLTLLHLTYGGQGDSASIHSFTVDSTGTTEIQRDNALRQSPAAEQIELALPLPPGGTMASERLMVQAGRDYHSQLLAYGDAIRRLHRARVSAENPIGWWSWTSYYMLIDEGAALTNAQWLAENLKTLGYRFFHLDEGYQYARGEYTTPNATQFPHGMRHMGNEVRSLGLTFGIWTAPFEVTNRAAIYQQHKDWLVHTAGGTPIVIGKISPDERLYALDTTHPGAQEYMRQTYRTLTREWGVRYIKLDFMDTAAIEGYRYRPNTTALEAERIGLEVIRAAVGDDVLLDKDGSPMLTPVGLVDAGRISADTRHTFATTRIVEPGIAARFYMHRNFYIDDPDAFNLCPTAPAVGRPGRIEPVSTEEAQASIALSAVSGGMYEIGDDLPALGRHPELLSLVRNPDLLNMAKLSRASIPMDLMDYAPEDRQPSIFLLREEPRQSILTVFNWTDQPRSHFLRLADYGLAGGAIRAYDVLEGGRPVPTLNGVVNLARQKPHSVRVLKLIDESVPAAAPVIRAKVPAKASLTEVFRVSAVSAPEGPPALSYTWDFGDGIMALGSYATHAYTANGDYTIKLTAEGLDGIPATPTIPIKVRGAIGPFPNLKKNRRYTESGGH